MSLANPTKMAPANATGATANTRRPAAIGLLNRSRQSMLYMKTVFIRSANVDALASEYKASGYCAAATRPV